MNYIVYTDGTYRETEVGPIYAGASAIIVGDDRKPSIALAKVGTDDYVQHHNVAGEVIACTQAMEHLLNTIKVKPDDTVEIRYDYQGIEGWTKNKGEEGYWRAKNKLSQGYSAYMKTVVMRRCHVKFKHTPGHSGEPGNELVDHMCRDAVDNYILQLKTGVKQ